MSAREEILRAVRAARVATFGNAAPALPSLPTVGEWPGGADGAQATRSALVDRFMVSAQGAAARVVRTTRAGVAQLAASVADSLRVDGDGARDPVVLSMVDAVHGNMAVPDDPHELATLDLFVCEGEIGVAESSAIWLPTSRLGQRAALLLATEVIVVLESAAIVADLHAAYAAVDVGRESFGLFLAGPSKTADIEQSLVIGAHGAKGLTVALIDG
ncbi:MAG: LUD domain-containing protein [Gemmatimonadaceae bacterium]|nr:LUD domain-containing protein [Gemmatimonadaceae bacterium]